MRWVDSFLTNIPFVGDAGVDRFTDASGEGIVTHDGHSWTWDSWRDLWIGAVTSALKFNLKANSQYLPVIGA